MYCVTKLKTGNPWQSLCLTSNDLSTLQGTIVEMRILDTLLKKGTIEYI